MLADKGPCIGGFYWDVNAITLFAFKEMKHLPIFPALLRETLTSLYCLYCLYIWTESRFLFILRGHFKGGGCNCL